MVTINELAEMAIEISGKKIALKYIEGPMGVRGPGRQGDGCRGTGGAGGGRAAEGSAADGRGAIAPGGDADTANPV